jgi:voltage-gated potassium channel
MSKAPPSSAYLLFILSLSVLAVVSLAVSTMFRLDPGTSEILQYADNAVCALFFLDFLISLYRAERKLQYLMRWGWLDLLSSIPMIDAFRWGRFARVVRILRLLRGIRAAKIIAEFVIGRRLRSAFMGVALLSILLLVISSILILHAETDPEANIKSSEDALWWAVVTITTVGYGDRYPISSEGRLLAALLMTAGVGLFGTFSGFVASWFVRPEQKSQEIEIQALTQEVRQLRMLLESTPRIDPK